MENAAKRTDKMKEVYRRPLDDGIAILEMLLTMIYL